MVERTVWQMMARQQERGHFTPTLRGEAGHLLLPPDRRGVHLGRNRIDSRLACCTPGRPLTQCHSVSIGPEYTRQRWSSYVRSA